MNTSATHPALTDLCLLIRDRYLDKWFATAPSSVEVTEHPGKIWGHSAKLEFKSASGTTIVNLRIRNNQQFGSNSWSVGQPRRTSTVGSRCLVYIPQNHEKFHSGFADLSDAYNLHESRTNGVQSVRDIDSANIHRYIQQD